MITRWMNEGIGGRARGGLDRLKAFTLDITALLKPIRLYVTASVDVGSGAI